jgi:DME family drug/metabolite transporter
VPDLRKRSASLILAGVFFGTTGTAQALGPKGISPLAVGSARLLLGAAFLYMFHRLSKKSSPSIPRIDLWLAAIGVALYQVTFFSAVKSTGVAIGTVTALGSAPALTGLIAFFLTKEKPHARWFIATIITTVGIIFLTTSQGVSDFNLRGFFLALGAGASYSLFAVASRRALAGGAGISDAMFKIFSLGALLSFPLLFVGNPDWLLTPKGALMILWLAAVPTALAYVVYAYGLVKVKASTASTLILAEPATATILASVVLSESINAQGWIGIGIVILGLLYLAM